MDIPSSVPSHTRSILIVKYLSTRFCAKCKQLLTQGFIKVFLSVIMVLNETLTPLFLLLTKSSFYQTVGHLLLLSRDGEQAFFV